MCLCIYVFKVENKSLHKIQVYNLKTLSTGSYSLPETLVRTRLVQVEPVHVQVPWSERIYVVRFDRKVTSGNHDSVRTSKIPSQRSLSFTKFPISFSSQEK